MARYGHRRDAEIKAICDYCSWLRTAVGVHKDDIELANFSRRCHLIAMRELAREDEATGKDIYDDRLADCAECKAEAGFRQCIDPDTRKYRGCKWFKGKHKVDFVKANFGEMATVFLEKYKDIRTGRNER